MNFSLEKGNLFKVDSKYAFAQCISLDCKMGAGIAVQFDKKFPEMKDYCLKVIKANRLTTPCVVPYSNDGDLVFNLITKDKFWHKPTYETIESTIEDMAYMCKEYNVKYLALPLIGCGLDKLKWNHVSELIKKHFNDLDIDIKVRYI